MASDRLVTDLFVTLDGADAPDALVAAIEAVEVECSLHLPNMATLRLRDEKLHWVDADEVMPGHELTIKAQVGQVEATLFDGEIVELQADYRSGEARAEVRALDRLHRLSRGRRVRTFHNSTDADIVDKLAKEAGLTCQSAPTPEVYEHVFQVHETDLEFLRRRAALRGYLLYCQGRKLIFGPPGEGSGRVEVKWPESLAEFQPRVSSLEQVAEVRVRGWDVGVKKDIMGVAGAGTSAAKIGFNKDTKAFLQDAFGNKPVDEVLVAPLRTQAEADAYAKGLLARRTSALVEVSGACAGMPSLAAGVQLNVKGVGDRFSGSYLVTRVTHDYEARHGLRSHFAATGLNPANLSALLGSSRQPQPGVMVAVVVDNDDPNHLGRVRVRYPAVSSDHSSDWVRIAVPGGGAGRGFFWVPEVDDEVLVAFEQGEINEPYVLGALWNGVDAPPRKTGDVLVGGKIQRRVIQSRTGHQIVLEDKDGAGGIKIVDAGGNYVELKTQDNMLQVEVQGNILVKSGAGIVIEAQNTVEIKGNGVSVDGGGGGVKVTGATIDLN